MGAPVERDFALNRFSGEGGEHADAIDGAVGGEWDSSDIENGGENIGSDDGDVTGGAGLDVLWPTDDAGDADAAFMTAALIATESARGSAIVGNGAVVRGEDDEGVVSDACFVQGVHHLAEGVVELTDVAHVFGVFVAIVEGGEFGIGGDG